MASYREIPDQTYAEAGQVVRSALGTGERTEIEVMPGFDHAVAATAIALAQGAPNAFFKEAGSTAEDFLTEGREEWRHFHTAVARAIDQHRSGGETFETTSDVMRHMAADVLQQAEARDLVTAATNSHPAFTAGMSESSLRTVSYLREDEEALADARHMAGGRYEKLNDYVQRDIASALVNGDHVKQPVDDVIHRLANLIEKEVDQGPGRERAAALRLGDFRDFDRPLFEPVEPKHVAHAAALVEGREKPWGYAEEAVVAHAASMEAGHVQTVGGGERLQAYARELATGSGRTSGYETVTHSAARIEADLRLTRHYRQADMDMPIHEWANDTSSLAAQVADGTPHSEMTPANQVEVYTQIHSALRVPGLVAMRLAVAGEDVENGDLLIGQARELAARKVTYVGVDEKEALRFGEDMFLPGDAVRLDPTRRVVDFDHETAKAKLGGDPLIVTKSIVEGVDIPNGMGGTAKGVRMSYELGGVEGRFPAQVFQHERGENHEYGVLMMEKERLWFVPMDGKAEPTRAVGAAREVTAAVESRHVGSLDTMRDMVRGEPAAGEFVTVPEAFGRREGPVELVGSPWMANASDEEVRVARGAIQEAAREAPSAAVSAARQAAVSMGR